MLYNSSSCSNTVTELPFQNPHDAITIPLVTRVSLLHPVPLIPAVSEHE